MLEMYSMHIVKRYKVNGVLHKDTGPAVIHLNGSEYIVSFLITQILMKKLIF